MYKVYHDPEGTDYLGQHQSSTTKTTVKFSEEDYKRKIEDLNVEVKELTKELDMVSLHNLLYFAWKC